VIAPFLSFNLITMSPASFSTISACNSTVFDIYASFRRHATVPLLGAKSSRSQRRSRTPGDSRWGAPVVFRTTMNGNAGCDVRRVDAGMPVGGPRWWRVNTRGPIR
jgi:hypothetical protein